jgi:hypothetical protein
MRVVRRLHEKSQGIIARLSSRWNSIKDSTNPDDFAAYLRAYPAGTSDKSEVGDYA